MGEVMESEAHSLPDAAALVGLTVRRDILILIVGSGGSCWCAFTDTVSPRGVFERPSSDDEELEIWPIISSKAVVATDVGSETAYNEKDVSQVRKVRCD